MRKKSEDLKEFDQLLLLRAYNQARIYFWRYKLWGMKGKGHFKELRNIWLDHYKKSLPEEQKLFVAKFKKSMVDIIAQAQGGSVRAMGILISWDKSFLVLPWVQDFCIRLQMEDKKEELAVLALDFKKNVYFGRNIKRKNKEIANSIHETMIAHKIAGGKEEELVRHQIFGALKDKSDLPDRFKDEKISKEEGERIFKLD